MHRWLAPSITLAVLLIASVTAAFTVYQNGRTFVAVDFSYMADAAAAIAKGVLPYRDFPFAVAPFTFVLQALLLRLFGAHFYLMVAYAALVNALSVFCVWIILRPWRGELLTKLLLLCALPMLSIYSIYFHPSYDSDTIFLILSSLACVSLALQRDQVRGELIAAGVIAATLSVFAKQNVGPVFLLTLLINLTFIFFRRRHELRRGAFLRFVILPLIGTLLSLSVLVAFTVGADRYLYWTLNYAATQRLPALLPSLKIYQHYCVLGAAMIWLFLRSSTLETRQGLAVLVRPTITVGLVLFPSLLLYGESGQYIWDDSLQWMSLYWLTSAGVALAETALRFASFGWSLIRRPQAAYSLKSSSGPLWTPLLFLMIFHASSLSQGIKGSTYALWPLSLILWGDSILPCLVVMIRKNRCFGFGRSDSESPRLPSRSALQFLLTFLLVGQLCLFGRTYTLGNIRLDFFHNEFDPQRHEPYPTGPMSGAAMGPFHQEGLAFLKNIADAIGDSTLFVPGEDPIYFAVPQLKPYPRWHSDGTVNPFDAPTALHNAKHDGREWIAIKGYTQFFWCPACTSYSVAAFVFSNLWIHSPYFSLVNVGSLDSTEQGQIEVYQKLLRRLSAAYYSILGSRTKRIETPPPRYSGFAEWDLLRSYYGKGYRVVFDFAARYPFSAGNLFAASYYDGVGFIDHPDQGVVLAPLSCGGEAQLVFDFFLPASVIARSPQSAPRQVKLFIDGDNCGSPWSHFEMESGPFLFDGFAERSAEAHSCGLGHTSMIMQSIPAEQNVEVIKSNTTLKFRSGNFEVCPGGVPWIRAIGVWVDQ